MTEVEHVKQDKDKLAQPGKMATKTQSNEYKFKTAVPMKKGKRLSAGPAGIDGSGGGANTKTNTILIDFIANEKARNILSYFIAKLEKLKFDIRSSMFRTAWAKKIFYQGMIQAVPGFSQEVFNIDTWFAQMKQVAQYSEQGKVDEDMKSRDIKTDWAQQLLTLEQAFPGILMHLYSTLDLEDKSHEKMASMVEYNKHGWEAPEMSIPRLTWEPSK